LNPSNHVRSPLARLILAAGGIAALVAVAAAAHAVAGLAGGTRGTLAGIFLVGAVFSGCGLASRVHRREPQLTRPAQVRLPVPARDACEPVNSPT
jgi:hypothetical protein